MKNKAMAEALHKCFQMDLTSSGMFGRAGVTSKDLTQLRKLLYFLDNLFNPYDFKEL